MSYFRWTKIILTTFCCMLITCGCGQKVRDSVKPVDTTAIKNPTPCAQIVMLPFADYTAGHAPDDSLRRQIKIQSAISQRLAHDGFYMPVEEDVVQYLVDLGIIQLIETPAIESKRTRNTLYREMGTGWSDSMKEQIQRVMLQNEMANVPEERLKLNHIGLNKDTVKQIGQYFGADFVLRGRIVEYEVRQGRILNPLQQGILPFFFDWTSATIFGVAQSDQYDLWQDLALGGAMGAGLGSMADTPFNAPTTKTKTVGTHPRFAHTVTTTSGGYEHSAAFNAGVWGAAGMAAAYLAAKGGHIPQAVVQISLALQDTKTGKVVWANRVEKQVEPVTMWADPSERTQMDRAIEEAAKTLAGDLTKTLAMCNKCGQPVQTASLECRQGQEDLAGQTIQEETIKVEPPDTLGDVMILEKQPENQGS